MAIRAGERRRRQAWRIVVPTQFAKAILGRDPTRLSFGVGFCRGPNVGLFAVPSHAGALVDRLSHVLQNAPL